MSDEYRVVGESATEGTSGADYLSHLYWEGDPTTDLTLVQRYAADHRRRGDRNVKLERRGGPGAPWEAVQAEEETEQ